MTREEYEAEAIKLSETVDEIGQGVVIAPHTSPELAIAAQLAQVQATMLLSHVEFERLELEREIHAIRLANTQ